MKKLIYGSALILVLLFGSIASAKVTINVVHPHGSPSSDGLQVVVDRFNEMQDEIEVVLEFVPYGNIAAETIAVRIAAGVAPDVVILADLLIAEWAAMNGLVNLDPFIERDGFALDQFWPSSTEVVQWLGRTWALPHTQDARALFYNKEHFAQAGFDAESGPETLSDLEAYHRQLSRLAPDGSYERVGIVPWSGTGQYYTWGWIFGADFIDSTGTKVTPDHPKSIEAMRWLDAFSDQYSRSLIDPLANLWAGDSSMMPHGVWGLGEWRQSYGEIDLGVAPFPVAAGEDLSTWSGIWTFAITAASQHPEEAWEFLKFASGVEGQELYVTTATNIAANREAAFNSMDLLTQQYGRYFEVFLNLMPYSRNRPTMPAGSIYWDQLAMAMDKVLNKESTPEAALEEARRATQQAVDEVLGRMQLDQ